MGEVHGWCEPCFGGVRDAFARNFADGRELGASVAVCQAGRPVVELWGGLAGDGAWRRDTIAFLASATKGLVAAAALVLVDRGLLDLDTPVAAYWPEFAAEGKSEIPLRWVLGHRSGVVAVDPPLTLADIRLRTPVRDALAAARPAWQPGQGHGYHCLTMGWLVCEVVRRVTGRTVGEFFAEEIAGPLGLDLHITLPPGTDGRLAGLVPPTERQLLRGRGHPQLEALNRAIGDPTSLFHRSTFGSVAVTAELLSSAGTCQVEIPSCGGAGTRPRSPACTPRSPARSTASGCCAPRPRPPRARPRPAGWISCSAATPPTAPGSCCPGGPMWPGADSPAAFGHAGVTGAFAFADGDLAFAYVPNRMAELIEGGGDRVRRLVEAAYRAHG